MPSRLSRAFGEATRGFAPSARAATLRVLFVLLVCFLPARAVAKVKARGASRARAPPPLPTGGPLQRQRKGRWAQVHEQYVAEINATAKDIKVAFFGDSITECWRARRMGNPRPTHKGIEQVWRRRFGGLGAAAFGVSGDLSGHLQWRLLNGEAPPSLKPHTVLLHIGTNDLGACDRHPECALDSVTGLTALSVMNSARILHERLPNARVVLLALLPRGDVFANPPPVPGKFYDLPSRFSSPIREVNRRLEADSKGLPWISYLDCSEVFVSKDKRSIDPVLMPDALHPSVEGYAQLAECLHPALHPEEPPAQRRRRA